MNIFGVGIGEIIVVVLIGSLVFGYKKIPNMMKGLGKGLYNFKNAVKGDDSPRLKEELDDEDAREDDKKGNNKE